MEYQLISYADAEEQYRTYIDEATPEVKILGMTFSPHQIVQELDPTAYRVIFDEFANHLWEDGTAIENYNDDELIECPECGTITDDYKDTLCKDCDKQIQVEED